MVALPHSFSLPQSAEVVCCPTQPHPPPPGLEAAHFPGYAWACASSPGVMCWPLPGLRTGLCTLTLHHQSHMLLLPPSPRLPALPPQPPLLGERWEFGRVDGGMHAHEAPVPSAGQGGEWCSLHKRQMCGGHSPPLQGRGCEHNPVHRPTCMTPARPTFGCHHAHCYNSFFSPYYTQIRWTAFFPLSPILSKGFCTFTISSF